MATRQEVIEMIRSGQERVRKTFGSLTEEQAATQIHDEEGGWIAKQILAHLSTNRGRIMSFLEPGASHETLFGDSLMRWNQQGVDARSDRSLADLLTECQREHEEIIRMVEGMSEEELNRELPWGQGTAPLSDIIYRVAGRHCIGHAATVEQALGLPEPT